MWRTVGVFAAIAAVVMLAFGMRVEAAAPFDRRVDWTNPTTYTDGTPLVVGVDNLVVHVFVCTNATDNAACSEIGQGALNATFWTGLSTQQVNETRWYRLRAESKRYGTLGAYDGATSFFLEAPVPGALPPGKTVK